MANRAEQLGHSSPSITVDVHSQLFDDDLDTVADRLNEAKIRELVRTRCGLTGL